MCAITSIVGRSIRSIESIDERYGGCWRRSSPKPPSHKPRRRLNSSSTPGPVVDCARAVWRETLSWVPFGAAPPQVTRHSPPTIPSKPPRSSSPVFRYDDARAKPTHARALRRRRRSLARSIARAVCGGSDGGLAVGHALRHALHTRHTNCASCHHASRASSPFLSPLHARMRALRTATALARSLDRARAVRRW